MKKGANSLAGIDRHTHMVQVAKYESKVTLIQRYSICNCNQRIVLNRHILCKIYNDSLVIWY